MHRDWSYCSERGRRLNEDTDAMDNDNREPQTGDDAGKALIRQ